MKDLLAGKKILVVDDEPDILDTVEELLPTCEFFKASSFEQAKELIESQCIDIAILDIMGVDGYTLLDLASEKGIIPVMLTAHALSPEDTLKSYNNGAASYIPKDELSNIAAYLRDVLEAQEMGKHFWWRWLDRFGPFYDRRFGPEWKNKNKEFLEQIKYRV